MGVKMKRGPGRRKSPSGINGQSPVGVWEWSPPQKLTRGGLRGGVGEGVSEFLFSCPYNPPSYVTVCTDNLSQTPHQRAWLHGRICQRGQTMGTLGPLGSVEREPIMAFCRRSLQRCPAEPHLHIWTFLQHYYVVRNHPKFWCVWATIWGEGTPNFWPTFVNLGHHRTRGEFGDDRPSNLRDQATRKRKKR